MHNGLTTLDWILLAIAAFILFHAVPAQIGMWRDANEMTSVVAGFGR